MVIFKDDNTTTAYAEDYTVVRDLNPPLNNFEPSHECTCEEPDQMIQSKKEYCSCEK